MVTKTEAIEAVLVAFRAAPHPFSSEYQNCAVCVVEKLEAHGITPRTIKAAFNTPKRNEGEEN